jgi:hypothetical protein
LSAKIELSVFLKDYAEALKAIDSAGSVHKHFQPGGPFGEADAIRSALRWMKSAVPDRYSKAVTKRLPDLLIPGEWAIEFKIVRPFGDNGNLPSIGLRMYCTRTRVIPAR